MKNEIIHVINEIDKLKFRNKFQTLRAILVYVKKKEKEGLEKQQKTKLKLSQLRSKKGRHANGFK